MKSTEPDLERVGPIAVSSVDYAVPVQGFTQAMRVPQGSELVFLSGITARNAEGTIVHEGDVGGQARQIYDKMASILAEVGSTLADVVSTTTYVTDMTEVDAVHLARAECFGDVRPASTTVEVSRFYDRRQLIEVQAVAMARATGGQ